MSLFARTLLGLSLIIGMQRTVAAEPLPYDRYNEFHGWSATERVLLQDLADWQLDQHSLVEAALIVAGHNKETIARYNARLKQSIARCRPRVRPTDSTQNQLRIIFRHTSAEFLKGKYQSDIYDLGKTLDQGDFNCLTATILFKEICQAFSIHVDALWEPSHVQCWATLRGNFGYIVETTAASDYDAVSGMRSAEQLTLRRLSKSELLAKVYYNKGVRALKTDAYPTALASTWLGTLLDPRDSPAQNNLRACFNNWALAAVSQNSDVVLAKRLLDAGISLDPNYVPFSRNRALLVGQ